MGNQVRTFTFLEKNLESSNPCVLLQVLESKGSSPGRAGFCMGVNLQGQMAGSIGGGMMEHKLVETAKAFLTDKRTQATIMPQVHSKQASKNQSGMICSGEQTVLLYYLKNSDLSAIKSIKSAAESAIPIQFKISPEGIQVIPGAENPSTKWQTNPEDNWVYFGKAGVKPMLHIVGGGHCALALSRQMKILDFKIHLYETRPEINTLLENEFADKVILLDNYTGLNEILQVAEEDLVVVMTFGYRTDDEAIRAIKEMKFAWLGLLGSRSKIAKMMEDYRSEGFDQDWLSSISAPVGMPIKSQTPEEIAVSIAAEIIAFRNRNL